LLHPCRIKQKLDSTHYARVAAITGITGRLTSRRSYQETLSVR